MISAYFDKIEQINSDYISVWQQVCNLESPTDCKSGVDSVGDFFANLAQQKGWAVERFNHDLSGNVVCITMNKEGEGAPLVLSGHMDTVFPVGAFGSPATRVEGDKIYGPGVCDCKGGVVAGFMAMDALDQCGYNGRPVMLLLQSDEENGSKRSQKATINYICSKAKDGVAFLNLEGHTAGEGCLERKGILTYKFSVHGIAAHSSRSASEGSNAIAEAAHKIIEIEKIKDGEGVTCACTIISAGTTVNTVPDLCEFKVNIRFATAEQKQWVEAKMQEIADTVYVSGCKTDLTVESYRTAMELSQKNKALLDLMNEAFTESGLPTLKASKRTGGSDAADITAFGIPCVDSLGVRGGKIHTTDEFAIVDSLAESAQRIAAVAHKLSKEQ